LNAKRRHAHADAWSMAPCGHATRQRFWIYAPQKRAEVGGQRSGRMPIWSRDLEAGARPPAWMVELAEQVGLIGGPEALAALPVGVIVDLGRDRAGRVRPRGRAVPLRLAP